MNAPRRTLIGNLLVCLVVGASAALPGSVSAQHTRPPQLIQEPFLGNLSFLQERGEVQVHSLMHLDGSSADRTARVPLEIEYGITNDFQISVETGGFNYARATGWSSPTEYGAGMRYGRYGLLPNLHASVTVQAQSDEQDGQHTYSTTSGVQLGIDIPPLLMSHLFTSVEAGLWNSEGVSTRTDWTAGIIVPFGPFRTVVERRLRGPDAENTGTVVGLVYKGVEHFDFGVATTLHSQSTMRVSGMLLSVLAEF